MWRPIDYINNHRFLLVLLSLLVFFVSLPLLETYHVHYFFNVFLAVILITGIYAITHENCWVLGLGAILAASVLAFAIAGDLHLEGNTLSIVHESLGLLFFLMIGLIAFRTILTVEIVTTNTLYGAMSSFLLIGLFWCHVYMLIDTLNPDAFNFATTILSREARMEHFIYYSFVTLTTLGYGDVRPIGEFARLFAWLEAVTGQFFLTVLVSQLVARFVSFRQVLYQDAAKNRGIS